MATGLAFGLLMPLFIFVIIYRARYPDVPVLDYLGGLWQFNVLIKILSLCVLPNLLMFLLYIRKKMDYAARGVLAATFVYAFLALIIQLF